MAQAYWESGQTASATFSLFIRRQPNNRGYLVFAGLDGILDFLDGLKGQIGEENCSTEESSLTLGGENHSATKAILTFGEIEVQQEAVTVSTEEGVALLVFQSDVAVDDIVSSEQTLCRDLFIKTFQTQ